jgi:hypothetical protein
MEWLGRPAVATIAEIAERGDWYGWRLIGANNRELGRSARSFGSYQLARRAVGQLKEGLGRLAHNSTNNPATGRWGWRLDLDGVAVAVSGRWYERDYDGRVGAAKFLALAVDAELADGVVTLHVRRTAGMHVPVGEAR